MSSMTRQVARGGRDDDGDKPPRKRVGSGRFGQGPKNAKAVLSQKKKRKGSDDDDDITTSSKRSKSDSDDLGSLGFSRLDMIDLTGDEDPFMVPSTQKHAVIDLTSPRLASRGSPSNSSVVEQRSVPVIDLTSPYHTPRTVTTRRLASDAIPTMNLGSPLRRTSPIVASSSRSFTSPHHVSVRSYGSAESQASSQLYSQVPALEGVRSVKGTVEQTSASIWAPLDPGSRVPSPVSSVGTPPSSELH
ncbi:hypothetical protein QBC46DRAFT_348386 [Diplogelasinospora grovesii]|uniref:Uncharacterized protein n=1 Tax=Diplogelasinospora grovesii TaxID=303347 RepID=A0AAN6MW72_9PEZI|nr:hypothetical protein QBC46DRAFT_348386 [Diplogelasinospora grovesii]